VSQAEADILIRAGTLDLATAQRLRVQELFVRIAPGTPIRVRRRDGTMGAGGAADLEAGAGIRVVYGEGVLRSDPPQVLATDVEVLPATP
jgi:hypothetical protein